MSLNLASKEQFLKVCMRDEPTYYARAREQQSRPGGCLHRRRLFGVWFEAKWRQALVGNPPGRRIYTTIRPSGRDLRVSGPLSHRISQTREAGGGEPTDAYG
jgi:hypothetical protein